MKLRKILLAVAGLALMLNASAQKSQRYYVAKPGTLVELTTEAEANEITQLTLQGKLNAVDFRHLRDEFKNLQLLDISNASISMYAGKNGTYPNRFYVYPANCIPAYAFCKQMDNSTFVGKETLTRIILPTRPRTSKMLPLRDAKISRYARYGRKRLPICCPKHWPIALQPYLFHWDAVTPTVPKRNGRPLHSLKENH